MTTAGRGADGKPRELHIAKALDVCRLEPSDTASHLGPVRSCAGGTAQTLAECPYFSTEKLRVEEALVLEAGEDSFISLLCVKGGGRLEGPENALEFTAGDSLFVPAGTGRVPGLRGGGAGENHRACPRGMTAQPPFQAERLRRWMDET